MPGHGKLQVKDFSLPRILFYSTAFVPSAPTSLPVPSITTHALGRPVYNSSSVSHPSILPCTKISSPSHGGCPDARQRGGAEESGHALPAAGKRGLMGMSRMKKISDHDGEQLDTSKKRIILAAFFFFHLRYLIVSWHS